MSSQRRAPSVGDVVQDADIAENEFRTVFDERLDEYLYTKE